VTAVPTEPPLREQARVNLLVEAWKQTVQVQQHFNDLELRIRNSAITLLAALFGVAAYAFKEHAPYGLVLGLLGAGLLLCYAFYFMDKHWYHRLLLGSVEHGLLIEKNAPPELGLTAAIGAKSPATLFRIITLHSSEKISLFYGVIAAAILLMALVTFLLAPGEGAAKPQTASIPPPSAANVNPAAGPSVAPSAGKSEPAALNSSSVRWSPGDPTIVINSIAAAATVLIALFTYLAARAAVDSTRAAEASTSVAQRTLELTQRPWVSVIGVGNANPLDSELLLFALNVKNFGALPARIVRFSIVCSTSDDRPPKEMEEPSASILGAHLVDPGSTMELKGAAKKITPFLPTTRKRTFVLFKVVYSVANPLLSGAEYEHRAIWASDGGEIRWWPNNPEYITST
jgi:hypothetical protein